MATIQQIKSAAGAHIETVHGFKQHKRENIMALRSGYVQADLNKLNQFIDEVRAKSEELEALADGVTEQFENVVSLFADITP
jgi:hypothetical protein